MAGSNQHVFSVQSEAWTEPSRYSRQEAYGQPLESVSDALSLGLVPDSWRHFPMDAAGYNSQESGNEPSSCIANESGVHWQER